MAFILTDKKEILNLLAGAPYPIRQTLLGLGYALMPRRLPNVLPLTGLLLRDISRVVGSSPIPDAGQALSRPDGLCAIAGRMDVASLLEGYGKGLFLMSHIGPSKWWAPRQRMVLFFDEARVEKGARRLLRNGHFEITFDTAFAEVMLACAAPRPGQTPLTWITPRIRELFQAAHEAGHAHSVEVWKEGALVGGLYGLAVGRMFFTESQFHTARDASKVGFAALNRHLQAWGFALNDGKHRTEYLAASGFRLVPRDEFTAIAESQSALQGRVGPWKADPDLLGGDWQPAAADGVKRCELQPHGSRYDAMTPDMLAAERSNTW